MNFGHSSIGRSMLELLALVPVLALLALLIWVPPDGTERAGWAAFIGHFHPIAIHLPIALVLFVPVLELAGLHPGFSHLRKSVTFVLGLALLTTLVAPLLGWSLAWSGGYAGPIVTQHMWAGAALAAGCWLCWVMRQRVCIKGRHLRMYLYAMVLFITVALVPITGYRGGQLGHGEAHLMRHLPDSGRRWLGLPLSDDAMAVAVGVDPSTFYGARIHPIFSARCTSCHGENKRKGGLRLDSYAALMRGGDDGVVVKPGDSNSSELFRRITLPHEHEDFMPAEGKRPLTNDYVTLIELWITASASETLPVEAIAGAPVVPAPVAEVTIEEFDPEKVRASRAEMAPIVAQLMQKYPYVIEYESRSSADLYLNAYLWAGDFGDAQLSEFAPLAEHIVLADLSHTSITDRSAVVISAMKELRVLHLRHTQISDNFINALSSVNELQVLNLFGTQVTPEALPALAQLPKIRRVYVAETKISKRESGSLPLEQHLVF